MTGSKDRGMAALTRAYALAIGKNVKTAQRHRAQDHPDWKKFLGSQAVLTVSTPAGIPRPRAAVAALAAMSPIVSDGDTPPVVADRLNDDLSEAEQMEKQHWLIWKQSSGHWKSATADHDDMKAAGFALLCIKARSEYIKARDARVAWEAAERRLVPISEFAALRAGFIVPLANLLRNLPAEIATLVNPNAPEVALNGATDYLHNRLQPQIQRLLTGLDDYLPSEPAALDAAS